jgi:hypothetical protein
MPPPELPTYQDCHELWSKKRRRQMREQLQVEGSGSLNSAPAGASQGGAGSPHLTSGPVSKSGSIVSQPSSDKLEDNSSQGYGGVFLSKSGVVLTNCLFN